MQQPPHAICSFSPTPSRSWTGYNRVYKSVVASAASGSSAASRRHVHWVELTVENSRRRQSHRLCMWDLDLDQLAAIPVLRPQ